MTGRSLFEDVFSEFGAFPRDALILAGLNGLVSFAIALLDWGTAPSFASIYGGAIFSILFWMASAYVASMRMIGAPLNVFAAIRFVGIAAVMVLPFGGALALIAVSPDRGQAPLVTGVLLLVLCGWLVTALLPSWPLAQALSRRLVSPAKLIAKTRGHRWSLILATGAAGSINKAIPTTSAARNSIESFLLAMADGVVSAGIFVLTVSIGVVAWRYAVGADARSIAQ